MARPQSSSCPGSCRRAPPARSLGLLLAEAEFDSAGAAGNLAVPAFALREVSDDERFTGGHLARASRPWIVAVLSECGVTLG